MTEGRERLPDAEIGERLRLAREAAKITQADAAALIDTARTTIVAIEQGKRRIQLPELQTLAATYRTSANAILRQQAVHLDLVPRFRKLIETGGDAAEESSRLLSNLVRAEVELENALGVVRTRNYPPERPLLPGDIRLQAEQDAQEMRDWLGLGAGSVGDILSVFELQVGIRVYVRRLPAKISGLFAYDERIGACMLLNGSVLHERIIATAIHEFGHFVGTRKQPEVLTTEERFLSREERYANMFQRCFQLPSRAVRLRYNEITAGHSHLTRRHIILLGHAFGVSREQMARRLEELHLAREGTWDWFQANGGITDEQAREVLGESGARVSLAAMAADPVPTRLALLVREAWKRELYSEGQLARMLELDRHTIRHVLDGAEAEESEAHELTKLPL
jgi:Zn-dependent peptidase ImmA (M78 family)/DNA-binding XRE family transcriptional regulator